jgi:hypothetical protein
MGWQLSGLEKTKNGTNLKRHDWGLYRVPRAPVMTIELCVYDGRLRHHIVWRVAPCDSRLIFSLRCPTFVSGLYPRECSQYGLVGVWA